ncbi:hypothetical protein EUX98_g922 [Antrodiella citrinella]|uniref:Cytochrome P450 n=1 Tax=Antrodiella citrinella TaxID=2447956 RepID=A0A4S4N556_9APHY|nr:hypothetical protein EUX98_g922 [Antrodiella citrinella]
MWQSRLSLTPTSVFLALGGLWLLYKLLIRLIRRSPLDNVPGPDPVSWWKGNLAYFYDRHGWHFLDRLDTYNGAARVDGLLGAKLLYVFDPTAIRHIISEDQHVFERASWFSESLRLAIGPGLLSACGDHHRKQRKILNPVFSTAHMKDITPIFYKIAYQLRDAVAGQVKDSPRNVDVLDWMGRTALELIGQGGLGCSFGSLTENIPNAYGEAMKAFVPTMFALGPLRFLTPYFAFIDRLSFKRTFIHNVPVRNFRKLLKLIGIMDAATKDVFLLAEHPTVQERLRAEIKMATHDGEIPYNEIIALPYLDAKRRTHRHADILLLPSVTEKLNKRSASPSLNPYQATTVLW